MIKNLAINVGIILLFAGVFLLGMNTYRNLHICPEPELCMCSDNTMFDYNDDVEDLN